MTVTAGQPRDMTGIGQGVDIWCCCWARLAHPSLPSCPNSAYILRPDCQEARKEISRACWCRHRGKRLAPPGPYSTWSQTHNCQLSPEMPVMCSRTLSWWVCSDSRALHPEPVLPECALVIPPGTWWLGSFSMRKDPESSALRPNESIISPLLQPSLDYMSIWGHS